MMRKGDTLVEVTIAIGIFSLIAITVASVMSSGTAETQLALETTLAREEIDTQAEALRFVHNAYTSNELYKGEEADSTLAGIWNLIAKDSVEKQNVQDLSYSPTSCDNTGINDNVFVLNPRELSKGNSAYIKYDGSKFKEATTYPRLIYNESNKLASDEWDSATDVESVEGIYVIGVHDETAKVYDFYIRTCWYGVGNSDPSTISTVVRLHDPAIDSKSEQP